MKPSDIVPLATIVSPSMAMERFADPKLKGLVIRQETQMAEAIAQAANLPLQLPNMYVVSALPQEKLVKTHNGDTEGWQPSATELKNLERLLFVQEDSNICLNALMYKLGMANLRPLKLFIRVSDGGDVYAVDRPFKCGGECCCPLTMNVYRTEGHGFSSIDNAVMIGRIKQDFDNYFTSCFKCCCTGTNNHLVQKLVTGTAGETQFTTEFVLSANTLCCGPRNNFCGATCCKNDMIFSIYDRNGEEVGRVQKTYGGGDGCGAFCRCLNKYDNYVLEFPPNLTSADDRMLILTSILQLDYHLFEKTGGGDGGGGVGGVGGDGGGGGG